MVQVVDGVLVMAPGRAMTGITTTRQDLPTTNYELSYQAKRITGSDFFAAATFPVGKSFVTLHQRRLGRQRHRNLQLEQLGRFGKARRTPSSNTKAKIWYKFRVRVSDQTIVCQVDDKQIIDLDYRGLQLGTRIETRPNQPLGFATYESTGALRNIEIRPLTAAEIKAARKEDQ